MLERVKKAGSRSKIAEKKSAAQSAKSVKSPAAKAVAKASAKSKSPQKSVAIEASKAKASLAEVNKKVNKAVNKIAREAKQNIEASVHASAVTAAKSLARGAKKIVDSLKEGRTSGLEILENVKGKTKLAGEVLKAKGPKTSETKIAETKVSPTQVRAASSASLAAPQKTMKGSKKTSAAAQDGEGSIAGEASPLEKRWNVLFQKAKSLRAKTYEMSQVYAEETPIQHKVLGWGYVLSAKANRMEVLFRDGIKTLIMGYKKS